MTKLPSILMRGEPSRLFPVLADTSKEGRTLSIFLACLENVNEFGRAMMASLDQRMGVRAKIETYTEVGLQKTITGARHRPDGLIVISTGKSTWTALVEAKVGAAELTNEQIEAYLSLAKLNGIDAVITLSNQFTSLPTHHPLSVSGALTRKVDLFHWSWGYVITQAHVLRETGDVADREQLLLLSELQRFLLHPSSGVKEFDQMPAAWADLCGKVSAGALPAAKATETQEVVGAWHQSLERVTSVLSRQLSDHVEVQMSRAEAGDPAVRMKATLDGLTRDACLTSHIIVPDAAAPIQITCDLRKRAVSLQMRLKAPADRQSTKARVSWLLRQLTQTESRDIHVRLLWPGRAAATQFPLLKLRDNPDLAGQNRDGMSVLSFEVLLVKDLGARFAQRKLVVTEMIKATTEFYDSVGGSLTAWQAKPPKIAGSKLEPQSVSAEALREQVELEALDR
jgi:hypothetical protein